MTTFPNSPRLLKGGIVLVDPVSGVVQQVIPLQYNPDTVTRSLAPKAAGEGATPSEALRLKGPPVETIRLETEIDAIDQLAVGDAAAAETGIQPHLAALELLVYPSAANLAENHAKSQSGVLEVAPLVPTLSLYVWSKNRVMPVRIVDFSIVEEAFDPNLNPIRARVSLSMRVLSVDDLGFASKGGSLYMAYQQQKEQLAGRFPAGRLSTLGLNGLP
jgi:hypothetical protein